MAPLLMVSGVMIAAGLHQIKQSTKKINTFDNEMANMKINFSKVN